MESNLDKTHVQNDQRNIVENEEEKFHDIPTMSSYDKLPKQGRNQSESIEK
jgi:hypothetical protein